MKTTKTQVIVALIAAVAIAGGYFFPKVSDSILGQSDTGATFKNAKIAQVVAGSIASASATSTSLYNSDTQDRIITSAYMTCSGIGTSQTAYTGAGLAALLVRAATTTTSAPANLTNTNYAVNLTVPTSTPVGYFSTSTEGVLTGYSRIWPAGTYLTFQPNATNTASCEYGVNYIPT